MTTLHFITEINAPAQTVFDLARSVDAHLESTKQTDEKAVAGRTSGLLELGETVTWQARHFGFLLTHKSVISQMTEPLHFVDEMVEGRFKSFRHEHGFKYENGRTVMTDVIVYATPHGIAGRIFDHLLLRKHLHTLISVRNQCLKQQAETVSKI
ncbi:SRPBCC family protein [Flavobacterium sp. MAH-1]|uniref:SRPBCC family protein n=1 Tax=Flavobacterium agri TaxID=2743471 RepID=A0A7Y9C5A2_9FLAO|nr:SRPBCC family protein [Flavobacterium agri]NUY80761.1 SRPBCC family protein [Flavobacterium agri]NYA70785.1 SRPBCC family protein [Flavobacterium agri]